MPAIKKTIFYLLLFSFIMEFQINVILGGTPGNMIGVILLYSLLGLVTHYSVPTIINWFESKKHGFWAAIVIHGLLGLIMIEWSIIGNTPWSTEPFIAVIAQLGMFAWWGTIAAMPYLLQHEAAGELKKKILWLYGIYAIISTVLTIPLGMAPVILMEPPVYLSFFYFYHQFAERLS